MILNCLGAYRNGSRNLSFSIGRIEVDDHIAEFLLKDAPDNFEPWADNGPSGVVKATEAPPQDKMVKAPARKKAP